MRGNIALTFSFFFVLRVKCFCLLLCALVGDPFKGGAADGEVGAITLFGTLMDYHGALQRYSLQIKGRYIEVRYHTLGNGDHDDTEKHRVQP